MQREIPYTTIAKWQKLLHLIMALTEKNILVWRDTAIENEYIASFEQSVIVIARGVRRNEEGMRNVIEIRVQDAEGREVDSFDDEDLSKDPNSSFYYNVMDEFLKKIQRNISGAEKLLDHLIRSMQSRNLDDEIPF